MAFTQKRINITFSMATGAFKPTSPSSSSTNGASSSNASASTQQTTTQLGPEAPASTSSPSNGTPSNTGTLSSGPANGKPNTLGGLRITSQIVQSGGDSMGQLECAIYGMTLSEMNQLATVGTQSAFVETNSVTLEAGDDETGMTIVFQGTISAAFFDGQAMPDVCFRIMAHAGLIPKVQSQRPISVDGSADAKTLLQTATQQMGLTLQTAAIDGIKLMNPYFGGSGLDQIKQICRAAGLVWSLGINKTISVTKPNQPLPSSGEYLIAPETGMVGYPAFNQGQVIVKQLWRPGLQYQGSVTIKSQITPANGTWTVTRIDYELDANVPGGRWFQTIYCNSGVAATASTPSPPPN